MQFPFKYRGMCSDANAITKGGYYDLASSHEIPNSPENFGALIMMDGRYPTQIVIGTNMKLFIRVNANDSWTDWREI